MDWKVSDSSPSLGLHTALPAVNVVDLLGVVKSP